MYQSKRSAPPPRGHPSPTPPAPSEEEIEQEFYNLLANDGGRPAFPIELRDRIRTAPELHRDLLQPWSNATEPREELDCRRIFANQYDSWRDFRLWQQKNRATCEDDGLQTDTKVSTTHRHSCQRLGFTKYVADVRRRLLKHWFTWDGYKLCEDVQEQDVLSTWIEYLNYGYLCFEMAAKYVMELRDQTPRRPETIDDVMSSSEVRRARSTAVQCERRAFWTRDQVPLIAAQLSITIPGRKRVRFDEHVTVINGSCQPPAGSGTPATVLRAENRLSDSATTPQRPTSSRKRQAVDQGDEHRPTKRRKIG